LRSIYRQSSDKRVLLTADSNIEKYDVQIMW